MAISEKTTVRVLFFVAFVIATTAIPAPAQDHPNLERGMVPGQIMSMGDGPDTINVFNGNLSLAVPLGMSYPVASGFSYGFSLHYNSNVWDFVERWEDGKGGEQDDEGVLG